MIMKGYGSEPNPTVNDKGLEMKLRILLKRLYSNCSEEEKLLLNNYLSTIITTSELIRESLVLLTGNFQRMLESALTAPSTKTDLRQLSVMLLEASEMNLLNSDRLWNLKIYLDR